MHALATARSGWTHLALAISFTGASAFSRASHTRGHLNSSALAGVASLAAARHLTAWRGIVRGMRDRSARRDVIVEIHGNAFAGGEAGVWDRDAECDARFGSHLAARGGSLDGGEGEKDGLGGHLYRCCLYRLWSRVVEAVPSIGVA